MAYTTYTLSLLASPFRLTHPRITHLSLHLHPHPTPSTTPATNANAPTCPQYHRPPHAPFLSFCSAFPALSLCRYPSPSHLSFLGLSSPAPLPRASRLWSSVIVIVRVVGVCVFAFFVRRCTARRGGDANWGLVGLVGMVVQLLLTRCLVACVCVGVDAARAPPAHEIRGGVCAQSTPDFRPRGGEREKCAAEGGEGDARGGNYVSVRPRSSFARMGRRAVGRT
ncbi:hypothetical protein B0H14DRAFT_3449639 [Mycena olivaceomarginata]|nr:hypothetical protein B0H14DRAFT_3449639 [Mycena olivaceomarginata]